MVVRVAQRVLSGTPKNTRVVVAADHPSIVSSCEKFGIEALLTGVHHASGSDRLAEACALLGLDGQSIVVNVQGDEPLIDPTLVQSVVGLLVERASASMATAAHPIGSLEDFQNPNVVKVVLDSAQMALYFSRAPIAWWRDGFAQGMTELPRPAPLRHIGLYAYRAGFLRLFPTLSQAPIETSEALEQLRAMWHGHRIAVHISDEAPGAGVDTPEDLERVRKLFGQTAL